jgi:hypothetical protein
MVFACTLAVQNFGQAFHIKTLLQMLDPENGGGVLL